MPSPHILKVDPQDYVILETLLQERLPKSGLLYNVLKLGQSLGKDDKISVRIYVDRPKHDWSVNSGSFMGVANVKGLPQNLVVLSFPDDSTSNDSVLALISELDWTRENQFEGIPTSITPVIATEAKKYGRLIEHETIGIFAMSIEHALNIFSENDLKALSTSTLRGSSLEPCDAHIVEDRWPEKHEGYLEMIQASIELCSSGGVYLSKETGDTKQSWEPVSFAVQMPFGSIHAFHTEPDHRRKGYGKIAMKVLVQNIAKAGRIPLVQIYMENDNSRSLNEGIGFKYSHDINLINFIPK